MVQEAFRDELRRKYPGLAKQAAPGSRAAAIRLFCYECTGGSYRDARDCELQDCFLWLCWKERRRTVGSLPGRARQNGSEALPGGEAGGRAAAAQRSGNGRFCAGARNVSPEQHLAAATDIGKERR